MLSNNLWIKCHSNNLYYPCDTPLSSQAINEQPCDYDSQSKRLIYDPIYIGEVNSWISKLGLNFAWINVTEVYSWIKLTMEMTQG